VTKDDQGFGRYRAQDYDQLVDCPVEMGLFWQGEFKARGIAHRFVVSGAPPSFDGARLLADAQRICETAIDFWHPPHSQAAEAVSSASTASAPAFQNYLFLLNAVQDGYGGLEHCNSTALICQRADLPRFAVASNDEASAPHQANKAAPPNEGYTTLLGLISHEYFHAWNVKCLRPAELIPYDYSQENYTQLLWFFEGFTSYYDDLLLRRAQLIDDTTYLGLVQKNLRHLAQTPGRLVHSVAQASFEAWTKYYRPDENTPNATVSYYAKGAALALCLDLSLRQHSLQAGLASVISLDDVMREVWKRTSASDQQPGSVTESILLDALQSLTGRDWRTPLLDWVHGTQALPTHELLRAQGVAVSAQAPNVAQRLGLRASDAHEPSNRSGAIKIKQVLRGSPAEQAGFAAGDEWLAVNDWRLSKLDDLGLLLPVSSGVQAQDSCKALVSRDGRLLKLDLPLAAIYAKPADQETNYVAAPLPTLSIETPALASAWLEDL
jgi:predicted metalloprotease with PDZ domain